MAAKFYLSLLMFNFCKLKLHVVYMFSNMLLAQNILYEKRFDCCVQSEIPIIKRRTGSSVFGRTVKRVKYDTKLPIN